MNYTSWLASLQEFKFTGKEWDSSKGQNLYDFGARTYDPALLRWTTPDPLSSKYPAWSPYAYCHNAPYSRIDPSGEDDYYTDRQGYWQKRGTVDPYDRVFSLSGDCLIIKDKKIMENMREHKYIRRTGEDSEGEFKIHFTVVDSDNDELINVFKFLSDNTDVEWSLIYNQDETSILGTEHYKDRFNHNYLNFFLRKDNLSIETPVFRIHNHVPPYVNERSSMSHDSLVSKEHPDIQNFVYFSETNHLYLVLPENVYILIRNL